MAWYQREIQLPPFPRGCHKISDIVLDALPELEQVKAGLLHLFIQHTSASLTINENADPDVLEDLERMMNKIAPEDFPYRHTCEGPDDMPGHVKSSLLGGSLTIPVHDGRLQLGIWQGICLFEHRQHASRRKLVATIHGEVLGG